MRQNSVLFLHGSMIDFYFRSLSLALIARRWKNCRSSMQNRKSRSKSRVSECEVINDSIKILFFFVPALLDVTKQKPEVFMSGFYRHQLNAQEEASALK